MAEFYPFFLVVFAAVFFSTVFRRLHFPWVIALILGGIIIGPHGLDLFEPNSTITFIGSIGLVFLMFMAGLETKLSSFRELGKDIYALSFINGLIPFLIGLGIGFYFGYGWVPALLLGIIFISSSIAVIIPSLEARGLIETRIGKSIVAATILEDTASLIAFSILLQTIDPITKLPLPIFYLLLFIALYALRWVLPKLHWILSLHGNEKDIFQQNLRATIAILVGTVIVFELLGLHPIIAGFFSGLVLSGSLTSESLEDKLRTISYGVFIPTFFIIIGTETDLSVFENFGGNAVVITAVILLGSMLSKFISGWIGGRIIGLTSLQSALVGAATMPQLSTTLAVVFTGVKLGILGPELITAMVILSVATVFFAPVLIAYFNRGESEIVA